VFQVETAVLSSDFGRKPTAHSQDPGKLQTYRILVGTEAVLGLLFFNSRQKVVLPILRLLA
jgi:23S rRNA maturation mini-RNase III